MNDQILCVSANRMVLDVTQRARVNLSSVTHRYHCILQRGHEALNQFSRYVRHEADRVHVDDIQIAWQRAAVRGDIERGKQLISRLHRQFVRQRLDQRRFSRIRVTDNSYDWELLLQSLPSNRLTMAAHIFQFGFDVLLTIA